MLSTSRRAISYPNTDRSDRPDIPLHFKNLADKIDLDVLYDHGTDAARIAATHQSGGGRFWWCTDTLLVWYDDGTTWRSVGGEQFPIGGVFDWPWDPGQLPGYTILVYGQDVLRADYTTLRDIAIASSFPHGSGNGTTTMGMPDYRGRDGVGKDNMGGVAANRVTAAGSGITGTTLGTTGGAETVTLSAAQMPVHTHTVTDGGHTHANTLTLPNHGHSHTFTLPTHAHSHSLTLPNHVHSQATAYTTGANTVNPVAGTNDSDAHSYNTGNPTTNPAISGTIGNNSTAPAIDGAVGNPTSNPALGGSVTSATTGITNANAGSGTAHNNMPPCIIVNKAMRVL